MVIEEFLEGDEISILSFSDGYTILSLPAAQDHKQVFDGDKGPNTGGMGCYAPAPVATPQILVEMTRTALQPTIDGMRKDGKLKFIDYLISRISLCGVVIYWIHAYKRGTEGTGIQCSFWRSRDTDSIAATQ